MKNQRIDIWAITSIIIEVIFKINKEKAIVAFAQMPYQKLIPTFNSKCHIAKDKKVEIISNFVCLTL